MHGKYGTLEWSCIPFLSSIVRTSLPCVRSLLFEVVRSSLRVGSEWFFESVWWKTFFYVSNVLHVQRDWEKWFF